jgi:hypothetical protein
MWVKALVAFRPAGCPDPEENEMRLELEGGMVAASLNGQNCVARDFEKGVEGGAKKRS